MQCTECGFGYDPDYPDNVEMHNEYHDKIVNGLYAPKIESDMIVWQQNDSRITVVNFLSPCVQRMRAEETGRLANKDTKFDLPPYVHNEQLDGRNVHLFLLHKRDRIIGFLAIELRDHVKKFTWPSYDNSVGMELPRKMPVWSIGLIWTHRKYRRQGLASILVEVATSHFSIEMQSVGWYTPFTDDGRKFAKKIYPSWFIVAK